MMPAKSAFALILVFLAALLSVVALGSDWESFAEDAYGPHLNSARPGRETPIKRAQYGDGRLWLLSDAGELWSVAEGQAGARREDAGEPAFDMCLQDGLPVLVTGSGVDADEWTIRKRNGGRWTSLAKAATRGEGVVALSCESDRITLLTTWRMIELRGSAQTVTPLSPRLPSRPASTPLALPDRILLGLNAGEWGGGLQSIDRRTGEVRRISRNDSGDLCGGPLNSECDAINGLVPSPWKPGCAVAAVGLWHLSSHGRLVEICGDEPRRIHLGPCPDPYDPGDYGRGDEPFCSEAFFGVIATENSILAMGDEVSELGPRGVIARTPLPALKDYGPVKASFGPNAILVASTLNQRHAFSSVTLLIVPRGRSA